MKIIRSNTCCCVEKRGVFTFIFCLADPGHRERSNPHAQGFGYPGRPEQARAPGEIHRTVSFQP